MAIKKLSVGSFGADVKKLQEQLASQGLDVPVSEIKRKFFGPGTRNLLRQWQKSKGINPSGETDEETAIALGAVVSQVTSEAKASSDAHESITVAMPEAEVLVQEVLAGDKRDPEDDPKNTTKKEDEIKQESFIPGEKEKKRLACLTRCHKKYKKSNEKLESLFKQAKGDFSRLNELLQESIDFDEASIREIRFAEDCADLTEDDEELVDAFLSNSKTNCLSDIALNLRKNDLRTLVIQHTKNKDKQKKANELHNRLFRMAPTPVIHRMARDNELELERPASNGIIKIFESNRDLDFRKDSVLQLLESPDTLKDIPECDHDKVVHALKCCQRLASVCPTAESLPKLMKAGLDSAYSINEIPLERFVALYGEDLGGEDVARIIHSQAQKISVRNEHSLIALRDAVLSPSINLVHGGQSTDDRQAMAKTIAQQKNIPINFETLFGSVDLCECKHCNSVYSPAAYLVELFQYLRNNNPDPKNNKTGLEGIKDTPLDMFFRRRPDLGCLQLTCENTNTLIPYIDLVNEVMESFVYFLKLYKQNDDNPKQATLNIYNVIDESSGELLAEPQHTNYEAYRLLKKAVYPVCKLPYHQPIDATRHYLNFLKTSRYELFSTFRQDNSLEPEENASDEEIARLARMEELKNLSVDRAIAAEYHQLVEEEYIILTKEGFHTKEWYELKEEQNLTLLQYQDEIGLKSTWNYYGIDTENQMLAELKWVKPTQKTGFVGFLRRVNIQYVDLIQLLKTRYINPNYLSGKALAYMNSLPYSYRYLQTLVAEDQNNIKLKYKKLVELLHSDLKLDTTCRFDKVFVECWVYKYFTKIGQLIVLENSSSSCPCIEASFRLPVVNFGDDAVSYISLTIKSDCSMTIVGSTPVRSIGHLDSSTGQLIFDNEFLQNVSVITQNDIGVTLKSGGFGVIKNGVLYTGLTPSNLNPFTCIDPVETCNIATTQLKHLDGTDLKTSEYDRIHRFIRLWCKLNWTLAEVDQAISGVGEAVDNPPTGPKGFLPSDNFISFEPSIPKEDNDLDLLGVALSVNHPDVTGDPTRRTPPNTISVMNSETRETLRSNRTEDSQTPSSSNTLRATPSAINPEMDCKPEPVSLILQEITPYLIEQLVAVKKLQELTGLELAKLLAFWTSIGTKGEKPLYQRLFLQYNLIAEDAIFQEDKYGTYLTQEVDKFGKTITISDHLPSLMAAFKVDVAMLEAIMSYAGIEDKLTLENVSHIYRHVLLAKSLGLPIKQLSSLIELIKSQVHPFGQPSDTLKFFKIYNRIDNSGFDTRELSYMIRNEDDQDRPLSPASGDIFRLAISLRDALLKIETDHADISQDEEATEEFLRAKLSLLFDGKTVEKIVNLVQGTSVYEDNTRRRFSANLEVSDQENILIELRDARKNDTEESEGDRKTFLQRVQFSGTRGLQVTGILSEPDRSHLLALSDLIVNSEDEEKFQIVISKILAQPKRIFDDTLAPIFPEEEGRAEAEETLLAVDGIEENGFDVSAIQKRSFLAHAFLPFLREQLRQKQVVQILASNLSLDQDVTKKLALEIIKTEENEALYYEITRLKEQKDENAGDQQAPLEWEGFFIPKQEGNYVLLLEAEAGDATLTFANKPMWPDGPNETDEEHINFYRSNPIFLKSDQAYPLWIRGFDEDESGKIIGLFMRFNDQPQTEISDKLLFPALRTESFTQAYNRLQKAAMLLNGFSMGIEGLEFFLEYHNNFKDLDFNALSFSQWMRLEAFHHLQKSLNAKELSLIDFLRWTNQTELVPESSLQAQISLLTGWEVTDVEKLIRGSNFNIAHPRYFRDEVNLLKLHDTQNVAQKIGVGLGLLFHWGRPTSRFSHNRKIADAIREAIRARYQQDEWEEAIKPVHDHLRENQKQALIAYLLAQEVLLDWGVQDADSLFEFFLIDVQMDACMETSRIKQAISSVQLFVQRCFLGLEDKHGVNSDVLDRQQWEWMSRYRVWEANRKVFLYPENWIRPELRDDKSPFFKELESELLQNDISDDAVKSALTKYIVQVDEVANLEVVGQFTERDSTWRKLHIIGRTRNAPYFFYYRCYDFDTKYWSAWEKLEVDIPAVNIENEDGQEVDSGVFVIPVVWLNRLFIFFPEFMRKEWSSSVCQKMSIAKSAEGPATNCSSIPFWEIKMAWSEYKEGRWTPKQISNGAIFTLNTEIDEDFHQKVKILLHREKFIFAPFVYGNGIVIQPYYLGDVRTINDELNEGTFTRFNIGVDTAIVLSQSFVFNGNEIRKVNFPVNDAVMPVTWKGQHIFHREVTDSDSTLYPIQGNESEKNPGDYFAPKFLEENNDTSYIALDSYPIQHKQTRVLLGYLRINRLQNIFTKENPIIPLSDDNYGSNNGINYHELLRPYSIYNWEILFHSIGMLADSLSTSQRFEEAMKWWHYIFDPINVKGDVKNVWRFLPFKVNDSKNTLENIFNQLSPNTPDESITEWRENPFMPHVIARDRTSAYMKWVVMKYIDNLIAWGDSLFRQDTIESINQATQLYILAGHILGPKPEFIPKRGRIQPKSYRELLNEWDAFSNAMVDLELIFPFSNQIATEEIGDDEPHSINIYGFATSLYFCIPDNPKLLEYWDTVADRLFKIRHCHNIEGVFRKLNLFEPPIDPALLVQAAAQGLSIGSVLSDLSTPMPNYRFNYLLARALEVTSEVKSLGNALLSALEKKDGESLSLLRSRHDTNIQTLVMEVRNKQLDEAKKTKESLVENRKVPEYRLAYFSRLIGSIVFPPGENEEFSLLPGPFSEVFDEGELLLNKYEKNDLEKASEAKDKQKTVGIVEGLASIFHALPFVAADVKPLGIGIGAGWGGSNLGNASQAAARFLQIDVNKLNFESSRAGKKASFLRQLQDRIYQANVAGKEIKQIDKQITTQKIRCELAQLELDNHQVQIDQTKETEEYLKNKFSSDQLYNWMSEQLKDLYYQTYSFAYDLAKKAEKVYRFDMGLSTSDFVKFGYRNSSKEGFLAGEQLYLALKRLENAYIETKPHDYEITKQISLRQINPLALVQLKEQGICEFHLAEELFDLDYPGHYKRRIKTIAISIPCIVGPNTSLNCTFRQLKHEYRNSKIATNYPKNLEEADERFITNPIPTTAIAVSQGQNDSGVFELTFQSERYLPFEGSGAISSWRLELPQKFRQFDYQTITDVILHLRYTSCEGGDSLKESVLAHLDEYVSSAEELSKTEGLFRMFSLPHEFPNEWHRLFKPVSEDESTILYLGNLTERFPFFIKSPQINDVEIVEFRLFTQEPGLSISILRYENYESLADAPGMTEDFMEAALVGNLSQYMVTNISESLTGYWGIQFKSDQTESLNKEKLKDACLVIKYQLN